LSRVALTAVRHVFVAARRGNGLALIVVAMAEAVGVVNAVVGWRR
jgi:hypothetical protein